MRVNTKESLITCIFSSIFIGILLIGCGESAEEPVVNGDTAIDKETPTTGYVKTTSTFSVNDTNLTWQDTASVFTANNFRTYYDAEQYCSKLKLDTLSDWRLPTLTEFQTVLYPNKDNLTHLWEDYYDEYGTYMFWTSSRALPSDEYYVRMHNITSNLSPNFKESSITVDWPVRCVQDTN